MSNDNFATQFKAGLTTPICGLPRSREVLPRDLEDLLRDIEALTPEMMENYRFAAAVTFEALAKGGCRLSGALTATAKFGVAWDLMCREHPSWSREQVLAHHMENEPVDTKPSPDAIPGPGGNA